MQTYVRPIEADPEETQMVDFLEWMEEIDAEVTDLALHGWVAADLAYTGLVEAGPEFDRQSVIDATNEVTDYTGGGLLIPTDWTTAHTWTFEPLDDEAFPAVALARRVGESGGTWPAVYNAANEVCVDAFHEGRLGFVEIVDTIARVIEAYAAEPLSEVTDLTLDDVLAADTWARDETRKTLSS